MIYDHWKTTNPGELSSTGAARHAVGLNEPARLACYRLAEDCLSAFPHLRQHHIDSLGEDIKELVAAYIASALDNYDGGEP